MITIVAYPLAVFVQEFLQNPECLKIDVENIENINDTLVKAQVNVHYCSTISLRDLKLVIGETEIMFDAVSRGTSSKIVTLKVNNNEVKSIEFKVAGIYGFRLYFR